MHINKRNNRSSLDCDHSHRGVAKHSKVFGDWIFENLFQSIILVLELPVPWLQLLVLIPSSREEQNGHNQPLIHRKFLI